MKVRTKKELRNVMAWVLNNRVEAFSMTVNNEYVSVTYVKISGGWEMAVDLKLFGEGAIDYLWKNKKAFYNAMPADWIEAALAS